MSEQLIYRRNKITELEETKIIQELEIDTYCEDLMVLRIHSIFIKDNKKFVTVKVITSDNY
ncbi:hypothetical protein LCGC14_0195620 [marine sediment metagenome]|uniref:Uncharacterized protein n=1 Tax=marine sediment metagenome TaxID=412755 RepID=A0A0F9UQ05_9ZZZZ